MKTKILDIIDKCGSFYYSPSSWNNLMDSALEELKNTNKIETLEDAKIKFMNEEYIFIKKGNPDNVKVIISTKNFIKTFQLAKDK